MRSKRWVQAGETWAGFLVKNIRDPLWVYSLVGSLEEDQFDRGLNEKIQWNNGSSVCMSSKNILETRPSSKLNHRYLGPFASSQGISLQTDLASLHEGYPVFHVPVICKHKLYVIMERRHLTPDPIEVDNNEEGRVDTILHCLSKKHAQCTSTTSGLCATKGAFAPLNSVFFLCAQCLAVDNVATLSSILSDGKYLGLSTTNGSCHDRTGDLGMEGFKVQLSM